MRISGMDNGWMDDLLSVWSICVVCDNTSWCDYRVLFDWMSERFEERVGHNGTERLSRPLWVWKKYKLHYTIMWHSTIYTVADCHSNRWVMTNTQQAITDPKQSVALRPLPLQPHGSLWNSHNIKVSGYVYGERNCYFSSLYLYIISLHWRNLTMFFHPNVLFVSHTYLYVVISSPTMMFSDRNHKVCVESCHLHGQKKKTKDEISWAFHKLPLCISFQGLFIPFFSFQNQLPSLKTQALWLLFQYAIAMSKYSMT